MIVAIIIWVIAWLISGTPPVEPWNEWFAFLLACSVASFAAALSIRHEERIVIHLPPPPDDDEV